MLQADIGRLRVVYDAFLAEYPLCYGYWKKYADAEAKYTSLEEATKIFDRGVAAVPYSVDLWGHYAMHKQKAGAAVDEVERYAAAVDAEPLQLESALWQAAQNCLCCHVATHVCQILSFKCVH